MRLRAQAPWDKIMTTISMYNFLFNIISSCDKTMTIGLTASVWFNDRPNGLRLAQRSA